MLGGAGQTKFCLSCLVPHAVRVNRGAGQTNFVCPASVSTLTACGQTSFVCTASVSNRYNHHLADCLLLEPARRSGVHPRRIRGIRIIEIWVHADA